MKKIKDLLKSIFSKKFVHPAVDERLSDAIDDKLKKRENESQKELEKGTEVLNSYLRTYFSKKYADQAEMQVAYNTVNGKWKKYCREYNSKSRLINLNKMAFENRVKLTIKTMKENELHKK